MKLGLSFDDVLLEPKYSDIESRDDVDLTTWLAGDWTLRIPIVSAPMPTVTGPDMCRELWRLGGTGVLHRFQSVADQLRQFQNVHLRDGLVYAANAGCAVGVNEGYERINALFDIGCRLFVVDIAHGHHCLLEQYMAGMPNDILHHGEFVLGSCATPEAADWLVSLGADAIRVGVGNGAACTTRETTGFGVPQVTALLEISEAVRDYRNKNNMPIRIISCGGVKNSGDIVKALAAGADSVMLGFLLAGCDESPDPGTYAGASITGRYDEGVSAEIGRSGSLAETVESLLQGIRSGLSYSGSRNLGVLRERATFIQVAPGVADESRARV